MKIACNRRLSVYSSQIAYLIKLSGHVDPSLKDKVDKLKLSQAKLSEI